MKWRLKRWIPKSLRTVVVKRTRRPAVGNVNLGDLRRTVSVSRSWGGDRGRPIDRYYIERFLAEHADDIRGRVLEIGNNKYTLRFGAGRVETSDVLDLSDDSGRATLVGDLADLPHVRRDSFDCIVCTQTLQLIPDLRAAVETMHRILKPDGVALVTVPAVSRLAAGEPDFWRLTTDGSRWLFEMFFPTDRVSVTAAGNVLTAISFLEGLSAEELTLDELDFCDPQYEVLVSIRAVKQSISTE